jgi:hypothetical protein
VKTTCVFFKISQRHGRGKTDGMQTGIGSGGKKKPDEMIG